MPIDLSTEGLQPEEIESLGMHIVKQDGTSVRTRPKPRNCAFCGRFLNKQGRCPKGFYDDYAGAWEHG